MEKKSMFKGVLLGSLVTLLIVSLVGTAFATYQNQQITAEYSNIKIVIDGSEITPKDANGNIVEPFVYNGTTYLPVRAVGQALGKTVTWDGNTSTVYLGPVPGAEPAVSYSRENPAPVGTTQGITISNFSKSYTAYVMINSTVRGADAWELVHEANMFNSEPEAGTEYIVVKATMTVSSVSNGSSVTASDIDFDAFSSSNTQYATNFVVAPDPEFQGDIYAGGSVTGYFVVKVSTSDQYPKIVYGRNYDGTGGIWFKL